MPLEKKMNSPIEKIHNFLIDLISMEGVTDILINGHNQIFLDDSNQLNKIPPPFLEFNSENLKRWILSELSSQGKSWDAKFPFIDFQFLSQHRVHICFPPIHSSGLLISIRKIPSFENSTEKNSLIKKNWEGSYGFEILKNAILQKESIIICGATGSGKTTLTKTLLCQIPHDERIIALEDTPELKPQHPHFIQLLSKPANSDGFGEITLKDILKQCLRMRPDRIILGECRGNEVLELLQLLNTGHRGTLATLHANSSRDALRRLELLCSIAAKGTLPHTLIKELIAEGIQWIVHVKKINGLRVLNEITQVAGKEGDTILLRQMLSSPIKYATHHRT